MGVCLEQGAGGGVLGHPRSIGAMGSAAFPNQGRLRLLGLRE